jgi:Phage tail lysozyme
MGEQLQYSESVGTAQPKKGNAASPTQVYQIVMQEAQRRGMNWFKPHHAMAMIGSFIQETGNFRKDVLDFDVRGDGGSAHGLMQWRGPRFQNLLAYAQKSGMDPRDLRAQVSFAIEEGQPDSPYKDGGSIRAMQEMSQATTLEDATVAFIHAERPAGYKSNNPGAAHDAQKRISHARGAFGLAESTGFKTADGDYAFTGSENSGSLGGSTYDSQAKLGYAPAMQKASDKYGSTMSDFGVSYDDNSPRASVDRMMGAARSFADGFVKGRGNPFDYSRNMGAM